MGGIKTDCTGGRGGEGAGSLDGDVDDGDVLVGLVGLGVDFGVGDPLDHLHAFGAAAEHGVFVVQPGLRGQRSTLVSAAHDSRYLWSPSGEIQASHRLH